jgi:general secretion pathway protein D
MKLLRFSAMTALAVLFVAGALTSHPAHAQSGPPTVKPAPFAAGVGRPDIPRLKAGTMPGKPNSKIGQKSAAPGDAEDAPSARRLPPPGIPRSGDAAGAAPGGTTGNAGGTGSMAKWQQPEGAPEGPPTLSKDFINNCQKLKPNVKFHLDIYQEELSSVVKMIACMTGKNIIISKDVAGKITIYSPTPVTANEAYRAFLSALEANGKTLSESGKFLKIIDIKDYAHGPDPLRPQGSTPPNEDRMVTQIVPLKNVDAQDMNDVLSKLATPNATFIVYQPSNSLIVTEVASNLRKLLDLLKELDVPGGQEQLWVYQVIHAEAGDISSKILEIFDQKDGSGKRRPAAAATGGAAKKGSTAAGGAASTASVGDSDQDVRVGKVIADERTNRLLIVATARSYKQIKDLIAKLDVSIEGDGQVHIHQLNHAKAEDLANVLSSLSNDAKARQGARAGKGKAATGAAGSAAGAAAGGAGGAAGAALFEGEVKVTADESTNSLVITSNFKDFLSLKKVIDQLDRPRRQVFLEAVVMEVSLTNNRQFGMAFHAPLYRGSVAGENVTMIGKSQPTAKGLNSLNLTDATTLQGLAVGGVSDSTVPIPGTNVQIPSFGAIMQALAASSDANILSTPNILTTDNEEAEIVVGSNVPFITQSGGLGGLGNLGALAAASSANGANNNLANLSGLLGGGVQIQRQDVALTLKITPRINNANFVTLEVDQVVEEIESTDQTLGPTTSKRSVKTTVVVKDQQTIVLGGLQKNVQTQSVNKVPFLGEIPIIGYFFRDTATRGERRNLILMLTPHVIESQDDFRAIFKRKMEEHREFVARFRKEGDTFIVGVDYAKKHGALESIHKAVRAAQEEQALLDEVKKQTQGPPLPQDVDGVPLSDGPIVVPGNGGAGEAGGHAEPMHDGGDAPAGNIEPVDLPPPPDFDNGGEQ